MQSIRINSPVLILLCALVVAPLGMASVAQAAEQWRWTPGGAEPGGVGSPAVKALKTTGSVAVSTAETGATMPILPLESAV